MIKHRFITLPNLVLEREVVPELLQERSDAAAAGRRDRGDSARPVEAVRAVRGVARGARSAGRLEALRALRGGAGAIGRALARDPHLSHVGFTRPPRHRAAPARAARERAGTALRLRRLAARQPNACITATNPSWPRSTPPATTRRRSAIASSTISFRCCARARRACAIRWSARICVDTKGRALPFVPSLGLEREAASACTCSGLLIMQYPVGSPWERVFGWRFLDPWDAIDPYASDGARRRSAGRALARRLSLDRKLAQRVPRIDLLLGGHSHDTLDRTGVRRRRSDRSRRTVRTVRFAQRAGVRCARAKRFALTDFAFAAAAWMPPA